MSTVVLSPSPVQSAERLRRLVNRARFAYERLRSRAHWVATYSVRRRLDARAGILLRRWNRLDAALSAATKGGAR
jgi:hypothetical protein